MTRKDYIEELSSYLDGEARNPEAIERVLAESPDEVKRLEQFRALSARLKALPNPEVHPAFTTRVMAHVRETRPAAGWLRRLAPAAALGLVALVAGLGLLRGKGDVSAPPRVGPLMTFTVLENGDLEQLENDVIAQLQENPGMAAVLVEQSYNTDTVATAAWLTSASWLDTLDDIYTGQSELDELLLSLDSGESETLLDALSRSTMEG